MDDGLSVVVLGLIKVSVAFHLYLNCSVFVIGSIVAFTKGPALGAGVAVFGSGSRWVGPGSASQTDAQTVDLTLRG